MWHFSSDLSPREQTRPGPTARGDRLETTIAIGLAALIVLAPWPFGSVAPWSQAVVLGGIALLLACWWIHAAWQGEIRWVRSRVWLVGALLFVWLGLALVPGPGAWVAALSPEAARAHQSALGPGEPLSWITLSVCTHGTEAALFRLLGLAGVFVLIVQTFRRKRALVVVAGALVAAALLEVAYGGYRLACDPARIFWNRPALASRALAGSFLDAGQLAGLAVMALSVTMGFWMASGGSPAARADGSHPARPPRRALLAIGLLLGLGICLTRSTAGLLAALASVFFFLLCVGRAARLRLRTLALFAMVALVLFAGQFIALEMVITWIESDSPSVVPGWLDRLDLYASAQSLVAAYLWTGSGLGTFDAVFPRFQSSRFGDQVAEQLENDWFQFLGEAGLPGMLLAAGLLATVIVPTLRRGLRRRDPLCRWVTVGALTGAVGVLVQSGLDGVVVRFASHGIWLAALLGVACAAARMSGSDVTASAAGLDERRLRLGPAPLRVGVLAAGLVVLGALAYRPMARGMADVAYNRQLAHQGQTPDRFFFWPIADREEDLEQATRCNARARRLDPGNPRYHHARARLILEQMDRQSRERARQVSRHPFGAWVAGASTGEVGEVGAVETSEQERLADALYPGIRQEMLGERRAEIRGALAALDRAVRLRPTCAAYRLERGALLLDLLAGCPTNDPARAEWRDRIGQDASLAMVLAPNKPGVLHRAGSLMVAMAASGPTAGRSATHWERAARGLRRAIAVDPDRADPVYDLVIQTEGTHRALFSVTPRTANGYTRLAERLFEDEAWDETLNALDALEGVARTESASGATEAARARLFAARRRATIHGRLGQWDRRSRAVQTLKSRIEAAWQPDVEAAKELARQSRFVEAALRCRQVLDHDPGHSGALVLMARLLARPDAARDLGLKPLPLLHRLIRLRRPVAPEILTEAATLAGALKVRGPAEETVRDFVRGVAWWRAGHLAEARRALTTARRRFDERRPGGLARHELDFYLGRTAESGRDTALAREAYAAVLARVPTHLGAWRGRNRLEGGRASRPRLDVPGDAVRTDVDFGGRVRLVAYAFRRPAGPARLELVTVWECGWRSLHGVSLRVVPRGLEPADRMPRTAALGGPDAQSGALIVRSVEMPASGWREVRLAVEIDRPDVGEEPVVKTDAQEPDLRLASPSIE